MTEAVAVDGRSLTIDDVEAVARLGAMVALDSDARERVVETRRVVEDILASGAVVYGYFYGFGKLAEMRLKPRCSSTKSSTARRSTTS